MSPNTSEIPAIDYGLLASSLASAPMNDANKTIVDLPFENKLDMALLFLGFICIYIVDEQKAEIQLKGASGTEEYALAVERYNFEPSKFRLHFDVDKDNTIVRAISSGKPQETSDWATLSRKNKPIEIVRLNQANSGIAYTAVYPFSASVRGALMFNFYQYPEKIDGKQRDFMEKYTKLVSAYISQQSQ